MLLIERIPTLSILARSHCGLGPTFTFSILRAEKNGHSRVRRNGNARRFVASALRLPASRALTRSSLVSQRGNLARQSEVA